MAKIRVGVQPLDRLGGPDGRPVSAVGAYWLETADHDEPEVGTETADLIGLVDGLVLLEQAPETVEAPEVEAPEVEA